jgi:type III secretory pathway component EscV
MIKLLKFFLIIIGLIITIPFSIPSAVIHIFIGLNMYKQKGVIHYMAKPYLYCHTELCHFFYVEPYKD